MNEIEYIKIQIIKKRQEIDYYNNLNKNSSNTFLSEKDKHLINLLEKELKHLQQIKTILEAWEVINEEFIIKPYYQVNGKYPAIMIRHRIEDDEFCRRGVKQEKYNIVKKALKKH